MKRAQLKKAKHFGDEEQVKELEKEIEQLEIRDYYHVSGFSHPKISIITNDPIQPFKIATWGLIPNWIQDLDAGLKFYHNTLNCRSETMFEKNSYKTAAKSQRCLIVVDGFYEHHHYNKKTFPFFIHAGEPLLLGGLWNHWKKGVNDINTFTIVTTKGNELMRYIHNNPKMKEARMPVILDEALAKTYIETDANDKAGQDLILSLCQPSNVHLNAHTVQSIRGKGVESNTVSATKAFTYKALEDRDHPKSKQLELF